MAFELGRRMVAASTFVNAEDTFYLVTDELKGAIEARQSGRSLPRLGELAAQRRELREARKKHRPAEFDKMEPGSILVAPLTTPAWTQLFAHAAGLVTDTGSLLAHGSIAAMFSSAFRPRCLPISEVMKAEPDGSGSIDKRHT